MSKLDDARIVINRVDEQMAKLFEERMKASKEVAEFKKENALSIFDSAREKELIERNSGFISDPLIREYYVNFLKEVMNESKNYQGRIINGMKVAYSGVEGAFAYIASKRMYPTATLVSYSDFTDAYNACLDGSCDAVVLPVENSSAGDVGTVMDLMFNGSLYINQMIEIEVTQNLMSVKGASKESIKSVYSHPQALAQCSSYIKEKGYDSFDYANTALAAKMVSEQNDITKAAIASVETAKIYNLEIIENSINSNRNNSTRFASFSRSRYVRPDSNNMDEHFILVFTVKNEAGSLAQALNIIGLNGFNMRSLRSRPMKGLMWNYYFYVELDGNVNTKAGSDMLTQLKVVCDRLKLVGTFTTSNNYKD